MNESVFVNESAGAWEAAAPLDGSAWWLGGASSRESYESSSSESYDDSSSTGNSRRGSDSDQGGESGPGRVGES